MDPLTLLLTFTSIFLFVLYIYSTRNANYWESRNVACPKPLLFFGNLKDRILMKISFHDFVNNFYKEMKGKPYAGMYEGTLPVLYVLDPDLIKQVLIKNFDHFTDRPIVRFNSISYVDKMMIGMKGTEWKKTRIACTPAFSSGRLKSVAPLIEDCAIEMVKYLNKITEEKGETEMDIKNLLINYSLNVIATTSFGVNLNSYSDVYSEFTKKALQFQDQSIIGRLTLLICIMYQVPEWITKRLPVTIFNRETLEFFSKTLIQTRKYRIEKNIRRNDLLQVLMDAETAPVEVIGDVDDEITNEKREVIDEATSLAQSVFFFIAGFETSSTQLSMMCYELAKDADLQNRVRNDVLKHWTEDQSIYDAINSMTYLDMTLSETLRMYTPVARLERTVTKPFTLGELKLDVGTKVIIPSAGLHYDPKYYPQPDTFRPERFSSEEKSKRPAHVFLGFGAGPRNCIGSRFANISTKICAAYLLKHYEISVCDKTPIPFRYNKRAVFLKPEKDIYLKLKKIR